MKNIIVNIQRDTPRTLLFRKSLEEAVNNMQDEVRLLQDAESTTPPLYWSSGSHITISCWIVYIGLAALFICSLFGYFLFEWTVGQEEPRQHG